MQPGRYAPFLIKGAGAVFAIPMIHTLLYIIKNVMYIR